jgi:N-terminal acetyltransferase B complex non-catalytic subunit
VVRIHKLGMVRCRVSTKVSALIVFPQLVQHIKNLRASAIEAVGQIGAQMTKISELEGTPDKRKQFIEDCKALQAHDEVSHRLITQRKLYSARIQITHEHVLDVGKKLTDSQKKVLEGVGRGIERVCKASM